MKPSSTVIFTSSEHPEEPPSQVDKGTLQGRVHRLDDLASAHGDPPGGGAVGDALGESQLGWGNRKDPRAAPFHTSRAATTRGARRERRMVFGTCRLRSRPAQNGQRHRVTPSASGPE